MNREEALKLVLNAYQKATKSEPEGISEQTDLIEEGLIDSLDSMTVLFEIEDALGAKLSVDEDYDDYKVSSLVDLVMAAVTN